MTKTNDAAVEWLIETVKQALEDGRATAADLEEWLLAAILLEELSLEEQRGGELGVFDALEGLGHNDAFDAFVPLSLGWLQRNSPLR